MQVSNSAPASRWTPDTAVFLCGDGCVEDDGDNQSTLR